MKLQFRDVPWDLYVNGGYVFAATGALAWLKGGNLMALPLILFEPGYFFVAALFPSHEELDWIERLVLSVVLSVAVVALLTWALDFAPWGIGFESLIGATILFILLSGAIAYWRRMTLPPEKRLH